MATQTYRNEHKKPQSIIHHIGRLGSKVVKPLSKHSSGGGKVVMVWDQNGIEGCSNVSSLDSTPPMIAISDHCCSNAGSCSGDEDFGNDSSDEFGTAGIEESCVKSGTIRNSVKDSIDEEVFETLDQNEFLTECFMLNEHSDVTFLVNFFCEESAISDEIEEVISRLVTESRSKCQCRRVKARMAPLFTTKLKIDPEQPTLVAIENGSVLSKLTDILSTEDEVKEWLEVKELVSIRKT
eukprot:scaffold2391_cov113-Cylindrotheca_fusiformis.AAC.2